MDGVGTVVLAFDDGRSDMITNVVPLLEKYSLPATFNITTGYIDGSLRQHNRFCENKPAHLVDLLKLKNNSLFEIASHGDQHLNSASDIKNSIIKLKKWGIIEKKCGFGSPGHGMDCLTDDQIIHVKNQLDLDYIRIGTRLKSNVLAKVERQIVTRFDFESGFRKIYSKCLNEYKADVYKCIPYNKRMNIDRMKDMALLSGSENKVLIILFHSVLKKEEICFNNIENIDFILFENLIHYLYKLRQSSKINIEKLIDV